MGDLSRNTYFIIYCKLSFQKTHGFKRFILSPAYIWISHEIFDYRDRFQSKVSYKRWRTAFFTPFFVDLRLPRKQWRLLERVDNAGWMRPSRKFERNPACWVLIYYYI